MSESTPATATPFGFGIGGQRMRSDSGRRFSLLVTKANLLNITNRFKASLGLRRDDSKISDGAPAISSKLPTNFSAAISKEIT